MNVAEIVSLITALGVGAIAKALFDFTINRRKFAVESEVAERTRDAVIALSDLSAVQERISALEKIIDQVTKYNDRLQADLEAADERDARRLQRIRELEEEVDTIRRSARTTQHMCDDLAAQLRQLTNETGRQP